jgi:hypothetical protein
MGRFAAHPVANDDPERLERVLNAKKRLIGCAAGRQVPWGRPVKVWA